MPEIKSCFCRKKKKSSTVSILTCFHSFVPSYVYTPKINIVMLSNGVVSSIRDRSHFGRNEKSALLCRGPTRTTCRARRHRHRHARCQYALPPESQCLCLFASEWIVRTGAIQGCENSRKPQQRRMSWCHLLVKVKATRRTTTTPGADTRARLLPLLIHLSPNNDQQRHPLRTVDTDP